MSQTPEPDSHRVRAAAEGLRQGLVDDRLARRASMEAPIPIYGPAGELDSWFVALTSGELLIGFFQLEPDLRLHRYSSFQQAPGGTAGCPTASSWLDPDTIRERALTVAADEDELADPVLGFWGNRDRLAWRVSLINRRATIYVVGNEVFEDAG